MVKRKKQYSRMPASSIPNHNPWPRKPLPVAQRKAADKPKAPDTYLPTLAAIMSGDACPWHPGARNNMEAFYGVDPAAPGAERTAVTVSPTGRLPSEPEMQEIRDRNNGVTEALRFMRLYGGVPAKLVNVDHDQYRRQAEAAQRMTQVAVDELLRAFPGSYQVHDSVVIVMDREALVNEEYSKLEARVLAAYGIPTHDPGKDEDQ